MEVQASMSGVKVVEEEKAKVAPHPNHHLGRVPVIWKPET
jgi:hypothetical protein